MGLLILTLLSWAFRRLSKPTPLPLIFKASLLLLLICIISYLQAFQNNVPVLNWLRGWIKFTNLLLIPVIIDEFNNSKKISFLFWFFIIVSAINAAQATIWIVNVGSVENVRFGNALLPDTPHSSTFYFWGFIGAVTALIIGKYSKSQTLLILGLIAIFSARIVADGKRAPVMLGALALLLVVSIGFNRGYWRSVKWVLKISVIVLGSLALIFAFLTFLSSFMDDSLLTRLTGEGITIGVTGRVIEYEQLLPYALEKWFWGYGFRV